MVQTKPVDNALDKMVGIIIFVNNQLLKIKINDQRFRLGDVAVLAPLSQ